MNKEDLDILSKSIAELSEEEKKKRDIYLSKLAKGEIQGPPVGVPHIDKRGLRYYSENEIKDTIPKQKIYDYFLSTIDNPNDTCIIYYEKEIPYKDVIEKINEAAKSLVSMGVKEGDVVTLCMPTIPETVYLFYALNRIGAIANMIDPRTNIERIEHFINNSSSKYVFAVDVYSEKINKALENTNIEQAVITSASTSLPTTKKIAYNVAVKAKEIMGKVDKKTKDKKFISWESFINKGKDVANIQDSEYKEKVAAGIVYTGGTTGIPKGAMLSNEDLVAQAKNMKYAFKDENHGKGYRFLNIMPPFIAYGLACGLSSILCMGLKVDIIPKFDPDKFDELIIKNKPEAILGVPSFFEKLMDSKKLDNVDLSFLKVVLVGGDALNTEVEEKINEFLKEHNCNIRITKGYGMTEVSAAATYTSTDESNAIGSVGVPMVNNNVMVLNPETGEYCTYNEQGEIYINAPTTMLGYLNNEEETKNVKREINGETWVKTSDIGKVTENGEVMVLDRIKRMVIRPDGHNVFPSQIENVIAKHPAVEKVAVVGIKHYDQMNGEIPTAFIVLKENINEDESKIIDEIEEISVRLLPERDKALEYYVVNDLPLTSIGKVDFNKIKEEQTPIINEKLQQISENQITR